MATLSLVLDKRRQKKDGTYPLVFLENPEKDWLKEYDAQLQFKFSSS